jgi:hypothetical protein
VYTLDSLQKARRPSAGGNYTYRQPLWCIVNDNFGIRFKTFEIKKIA